MKMTNKTSFMSVVDDVLDLIPLFRDALSHWFPMPKYSTSPISDIKHIIYRMLITIYIVNQCQRISNFSVITVSLHLLQEAKS